VRPDINKKRNGGERLAASTPLIVAAPESVNGGQSWH
jgi:hypothetical protein